MRVDGTFRQSRRSFIPGDAAVVNTEQSRAEESGCVVLGVKQQTAGCKLTLRNEQCGTLAVEVYKFLFGTSLVALGTDQRQRRRRRRRRRQQQNNRRESTVAFRKRARPLKVALNRNESTATVRLDHFLAPPSLSSFQS